MGGVVLVLTPGFYQESQISKPFAICKPTKYPMIEIPVMSALRLGHYITKKAKPTLLIKKR